MKRLISSIAVIAFLLTPLSVFAVEKAERISDREIIESLAEIKADIKGLDVRFKALEQRIDGLDKRMDRLENRMERLEGVMMWGFGLIFTSMVGLVGFVLWDRRSALAPAIRKTRELEEREELLERALKEYARMEPRLADVLKSLKVM